MSGDAADPGDRPESVRPPGPTPAAPARLRPVPTAAQIRATRSALGYGLLFMVIGGTLALIAGFGFTAMAGTSCFEGYCAYVPFLYFAPLGMAVGFVMGAKLGGRRG